MAVDTRDKRASALKVAMPWRSMLPLPDGAALNQGDRQHVAFLYRGIAASAVTVATLVVLGAEELLQTRIGAEELRRSRTCGEELRRSRIGVEFLRGQ